MILLLASLGSAAFPMLVLVIVVCDWVATLRGDNS